MTGEKADGAVLVGLGCGGTEHAATRSVARASLEITNLHTELIVH
jgi:hypothetical protein